MEKKIIIRKAKIEELSRVLYVTKIAYKTPFLENGIVTTPHFSKDLKDEFLNKKIGILVALCSDKVIGAQKYRINGDELYIYQLAVLKTYRGLEIGSKLIKETEKIAQKNMLKKVVLDCMKEKELPGYYLSLGYKIDKTEKVKNYHMVYMYKDITK